METANLKKPVPVSEGLFNMGASAEDTYLIGAKCADCGEVFFPKQGFCANCSGGNMAQIKLSRVGKLQTYTVVMQRPPVYQGPVPYAIGSVLMPEKVYVPALIIGMDFSKLKIGMDMEFYLQKLREDEAGNDVIAFMFRPVNKE